MWVWRDGWEDISQQELFFNMCPQDFVTVAPPFPIISGYNKAGIEGRT